MTRIAARLIGLWFAAPAVQAQERTALRLQQISYVNPLRHIVAFLRSVYLKGVGLDVLWSDLAPMAVFAAVMLTISVMRFRKSVE